MFKIKPDINIREMRILSTYFDRDTGRNESQTGSKGAIDVLETGNSVKDKIYGSANITKNYEIPMRGFEIANDGVSNLTYTINGMTFDVKAGEVDYNQFDPFTTVTITATTVYRARVFG
jgi:uncharacterized lipoprotein YajG